MKSTSIFTRCAIAILLMVALQSCEKKNDPTPINANDHVNSWILDNMSYWYFWNSNIPTNPDKTLEPEPFFKSLLSSEDRFSWIQADFTQLVNSLRGVSKEPGFEFVLYKESTTSSNVLMQVLYVKDNSAAASAGLKRGDVVTAINGTTITTDNYQDLLPKLSANHTLTYRALNVDSQAFGTPSTLSLVPTEYAEDPNFLNKVVTYGDRKIGYYVYNLFSEGPDSNSKTYTTEMESIFSSFQSQGITDLVLDLRFNSGGAETAAQNLASLIVKNVTASTVFVQHDYNSKVTADIKANPNLGEGFLTVPFLVKSQNVGSQLRDGRVYILTGSRTASASELIINGLKPYMDVFLIGNTTVGKNVGSISIYDDSDTQNTWGLQPIVVRLSNSQGQSDYSSGFTPQIINADNSLYLYPIGDSRETLLNIALQQITGLSNLSKVASEPTGGEALFHSLDSKPRSGIVVIPAPK